MNELEDAAEISFASEDCFRVSWSLRGAGFGDLTFFNDGLWKIDAETCSKNVVKKVLGILVDSLEMY